MITKVTESIHPGEFIVSEANGYRSRESVTIASGQSLVAGSVVGKVTAALTVAAPGFSGTGNGAITVDGTTPVLDDAKVGTYSITCIAAVTNGGEFEVVDPDGISLGSVKVGATFSNKIKFAIADGGTDFVVGDKFTFVVTAGSGKYKAVPASAANDGTDNAAGILFAAVDASAADQPGVIIARDAEVDSKMLTYSTTTISTACNTQLGALGIIVRS